MQKRHCKKRKMSVLHGAPYKMCKKIHKQNTFRQQKQCTKNILFRTLPFHREKLNSNAFAVQKTTQKAIFKVKVRFISHASFGKQCFSMQKST